MANIMSNLKSRFSKESKEPEEIEFSEISEQYSNKKKMPNPNFWQIYTAQKKCEEDISKYESQLEELQKKREDFADFLEPLGLSEAEQKSAFSDIDNEINNVKSNILTTRTNLSKTYEQIKMAQTSLDDYIKLASANPDFQISLRDAVINNSNTKIKEATAEKAKQSSYISFIEKLEDKAKNDPALGDIFSSIEQARADKRKAASLEELKSNLQKLLGDVSKDNVDNLNNAIQTINSEVDSQKQNKSDTLQEEYQKLRDYISNNRKDFGLPEGTDDLKFDDKDSPLYVVTEFTDPNHDRSLKDIKQNHKDEINKIDRNISEYNKYIDFAKEDIKKLDVEREAYYQGLYVSPWTRIKNFFKTVGHGIKNWFQDKPFKDPDEKQSIPAPKTTKVVDKKDFRDAYKTEIGEDVYKQVLDNYKAKVKQQKIKQYTRNQNGQSR